MEKGTKNKVFWITGLSGAGKTTIGKALYKELRLAHENIVFLDGDELREIYGNDLGYSLIDRKKCALRNAKLCKVLSDQGIIVICATISMFHEIHAWNRKNIKKYVEIYLKVTTETLRKRDQKNMYSSGSKNLAGIDVEVEEPIEPNILIENDGDKTPEKIVKQISKYERN